MGWILVNITHLAVRTDSGGVPSARSAKQAWAQCGWKQQVPRRVGVSNAEAQAGGPSSCPLTHLPKAGGGPAPERGWDRNDLWGPNGGCGFIVDGNEEPSEELQGKAEVSKYTEGGETDCIQQTKREIGKWGRQERGSQNDCWRRQNSSAGYILKGKVRLRRAIGVNPSLSPCPPPFTVESEEGRSYEPSFLEQTTSETIKSSETGGKAINIQKQHNIIQPMQKRPSRQQRNKSWGWLSGRKYETWGV